MYFHRRARVVREVMTSNGGDVQDFGSDFFVKKQSKLEKKCTVTYNYILRYSIINFHTKCVDFVTRISIAFSFYSLEKLCAFTSHAFKMSTASACNLAAIRRT